MPRIGLGRTIVEMNSQQREEVERRVLALVRSRLDECDEWYPDGYEIGDFIFLYQILIAPDRDSPPDPWHGGGLCRLEH